MLFRALILALSCTVATGAAAQDCAAPARAAEETFGIPSGLLAAVGRTESGRRSADGKFEAWPWSVNAAGRGYFLSDQNAAIALVASLLQSGIRSVDVGCFQMNLLHHPEAFSSLEQAFDPAQNAMAAGRFLRTLRDSGASWEDAVGRYHSANPALGIPYMRQVWANWQGIAPGGAPPISRVAALVQVIVPGAKPAVFAGARGKALPVVYTPSR